MPLQEHGRKSVAMITKTQFPEDPSRNLADNQLTKELMSLRGPTTGDARDVMNFLIDPKPQEPPTMDQLAAREDSTKYTLTPSISPLILQNWLRCPAPPQSG